MNATALVTPLFQEYELAPLPFSVTAVPAQTVWLGPPLTLGNGLTVTVTCEVLFQLPKQPLELVPVTVYVCVDIGMNGTPLVIPFVQV